MLSLKSNAPKSVSDGIVCMCVFAIENFQWTQNDRIKCSRCKDFYCMDKKNAVELIKYDGVCIFFGYTHNTQLVKFIPKAVYRIDATPGWR